MAQKKKGHKKTSGKKRAVKIIVAALLILLAVFIIAFLIWNFMNPETEEDEEIRTVSQSEMTVEEENGMSFPCVMEDGRLEAKSIFQYSGNNPDCNDESGENIVSLEMVNQSDQFLVSAQFTAKLADGTEVQFEVTDVLAGQKVWAFAKDNTAYELENVCESLTCTSAQFEDSAPVMSDKLSYTVNGTEVTLTNHSGETLTNIRVSCHCLFDDACFGGSVYVYPVESIAAGESVTVQAEDCYLGEAAVVRIEQDN
ncbi:MAG: hypothetical protein MRZ59_09435 [Clostridiales bacterium]|nr:hypothetical protein [Clostridiales bacterium]MDY3745687.1 hypothetical protein [Lachnospiraceae bacterium]